MRTLPPWLTIAQAAEHCGVDRAEVYYRLLQQLDVRRIGTRRGAAPWGRLIRIERGSVLRMCGEPVVPAEVLPRWATLRQAASYYQVSAHLIRLLIAHSNSTPDASALAGLFASTGTRWCSWAASASGGVRDSALHHRR